MVEEAHVYVQASAKDMRDLSYDSFTNSSITIAGEFICLNQNVMP